MPKLEYDLEGKRPRLEIEYGRAAGGLRVKWNGEVVREIRERAALEAGATFALPDGTTLFVRRVPRAWWSIALHAELRVERDGVPVPGSDAHPRVVARRAARLLVMLAIGEFLLLTMWAFLSRPGAHGFGVVALESAVLLVLGICVFAGLQDAILVAAAALALLPLADLTSPASFSLALIVLRAALVAYLIDRWRRMRIGRKRLLQAGAAPPPA